MPKKYDEHGCRLTDCCGTYSTYMDDEHDVVLCCKKCYEQVPLGQGDGSEVIIFKERMMDFYDWVQEVVNNINGIVQEWVVDDDNTLTITVESPESVEV